jgi:hypothetical protein
MRFAAGQIEDDVGAAVAVVREGTPLGRLHSGKRPTALQRLPQPGGRACQSAVSAAGDADPRCIPDTDRR